MLDSVRSFFKPLFSLDHNELVTRFLYTVVTSVIVVIVFEVGLYWWDGGSLFGKATSVLIGLLILQFVFLLMLYHGYATRVAGLLVTTGWIGITYQAWNADGVRDVAIYAYVLVILMAALLISWRASLTLSALSIVAIWVLALAEARGMKMASVVSPIDIARDLTAVFLLLIVLVFLLVNTLRQTLQKMQTTFEEQVRAELAFVRSEERFRRVFQTSPVAIVITTLEDGKLLEANQAFWDLSGHDPETSLGRTAFDLRPGLKLETRAQFIKDLSEKKSIHNPSYDFVNRRGEHIRTMAFYELIDMDGEVAILSMFYDVTEQNKARDALFQSELRLRAMLEAVPDMIFELSSDGTIVQFMPSASTDLMLPDKIIGRNIADILPMVAEQTRFVIERALGSGQVNSFEFQLQGNKEDKTFEARVTALSDDLVLAIVRDVTLQKWALSEREGLIDELEAKNAELERFTYTASHDLKSPLITIKGFLGFVREDARAGNMTRLDHDIQRIGDAAEKMQKLLADLLELARIGRIVSKPSPIRTDELVSEVAELLQGRILAGNIDLTVAKNLPVIYGDRPRISEVFQNLIDNAAKFMGNQPNPRIEIGMRGSAEGQTVFFVRDNGIGIAPQFKDKIFGLFDKLNAQTEGTGIGLTLVKRIIEFHGGKIWIESEVGAGTTFLFTLPTQPEPEI